MALTITARGAATRNTAETSWVITPPQNFAAGLAVMCLSADNSGTNGVHNITAVADSKGNEWIIRRTPLVDPGAALAGVQGIIATTQQNVGLIATTDTITVTFTDSTTPKTAVFWQVTPAAGKTVEYVTGNEGVGSTTATPTVTTDVIPTGDAVICACFNEYGTTQTTTADSDTTNGSWSAQQIAEIGTTGSGINVASQNKVVTADGQQTYNLTLSATPTDNILSWIQLREGAVPYRNPMIQLFAH